MKKLISLRISALTEAQLHELTTKLGMSQTETVTLAVNNLYEKMEEKMICNINNTTKQNIIDWVGDADGFVNSLTDKQAEDMLEWLTREDINIERNEDIEKLRDYCESL